MKRLHRLTVVDWLAIVFIVAVLGGLLMPDSAMMVQRNLEKRARDFVPTHIDTFADESLIATDADIAGTWICRHRLNRSAITFSQRGDGRFETAFRTSGCLGGCELTRMASVERGVIRLDGAVAEYRPRTYDALYVIQIDGSQYLLPSVELQDFEEELKSGSNAWERRVFRREDRAIP